MQGQWIEEVGDLYEQGLEVFEAVEKRRAKRGYSAWEGSFESEKELRFTG